MCVWRVCGGGTGCGWLRHRHLQQAMLTQFIKSSSKLSPGCANVLRAVAFRPTAAIVLKDCSLNDFDMQFVAYFATQDAPCTSTMDVSWNRIGQRGASAMSNTLRQVQYLHNVDLSWTLFGDEGFKLLSSGIASNRSVVQLNLAGTRISERSGRCVVRAPSPSSSSVVTLELTGTWFASCFCCVKAC